MDRRERVADQKADEILKKFADDMVKIYDEEAKELMRQAEAEGMPDIKLRTRKPVNIRKRVLRIAAMFLVIVFVGSIVIPVPKADAWRVWWLDLLMGENTQDIDVNTNDVSSTMSPNCRRGLCLIASIKMQTNIQFNI